MSELVEVKVLLGKNGILPKQMTPGSAGFDFFAPVDAVIFPKEIVKIDTRVRFKFPPKTWIQLATKSSHAIKGLTVLGGVCDNDYRGNIIFIIKNLSEEIHMIKKGGAVGQGIFQTMTSIEFSVTTEREAKWNSGSERKAQGFGSTTVGAKEMKK